MCMWYLLLTCGDAAAPATTAVAAAAAAAVVEPTTASQAINDNSQHLSCRPPSSHLLLCQEM